MSMVTAFVAELRERRLLPLVIVLIVGIVAVPMVLAKSAATTSTSAPPSGVPVSSNPTKPSVSLASTAPATPPYGLGRDPFTPPLSTAAHASASTLGGASSFPATPAKAISSLGGGGGGTGPITPPSTTTPTTGATTPTTGPTDPVDEPSTTTRGLSSTQAYRVTLAITNSGGGLDTISPLERLSVLPSQRHPLLVELGVLDGGHRVLFAVQSGAVVRGPGKCTPGPINCQILSLAPAQTETLSSANGAVSHVLLAVTAVTAAHYRSPAAAKRARRMASAAGRKLIRASTLNALSLFQYDPARGTVFDLRNLGVGGR